jgi:hypothetical protein
MESISRENWLSWLIFTNNGPQRAKPEKGMQSGL